MRLSTFCFSLQLSILKNGHCFACAKPVLSFSNKFFDYKETRLYCFARSFFSWKGCVGKEIYRVVVIAHTMCNNDYSITINNCERG